MSAYFGSMLGTVAVSALCAAVPGCADPTASLDGAADSSGPADLAGTVGGDLAGQSDLAGPGGDGGALPPIPHGVFVPIDASGMLTTQLLASTNYAGLYFKYSWDQVYPLTAGGAYDWSLIDSDLAKVPVGKLIAISIRAGNLSSKFCAANPTSCLVVTWNRANAMGCRTITIPDPSDTTFRDEYRKLVTAFGARYAADTRIVLVKMPLYASDTSELFIPNRDDSAACTGVNANAIAAYIAKGDTSKQIIANWTAIVAAYQAAFPNQYLELQQHPQGTPPLSVDVVTATGQAYDCTTPPTGMAGCPGNDPGWIMVDLVDAALGLVGNRLFVQSNGLAAGGGSSREVVNAANGNPICTGNAGGCWLAKPASHAYAGYQMNLAVNGMNVPGCADYRPADNTPLPATGACPQWLLSHAYAWGAGITLPANWIAGDPAATFKNGPNPEAPVPASLFKILEIYASDVVAFPAEVQGINAAL